MAQLIAVGLIGGLVWYGYNAFRKQMDKVGEELKEKQREANGGAKTVDELEIGSDGVYRPKGEGKNEDARVNTQSDG